MPGLKELEYLREELRRLGDERAVTAARGETYEELPHPTSVAASAPKLDVDGLLASLGPSQGEKSQKPSGPSDVSGFDALLASLPLDKPEKPEELLKKRNGDYPVERYPSELSSAQTYGHTGFTGTCVWVDPQYNILYIFLSNRVNPTRNNPRLSSMNIRGKIQDAIYKGLGVGEMVIDNIGF